MKNFAVKPLAIAIALGSTPALAQAPEDETKIVEEVVVTGSYRESLEAALELKRNSANNRESIVAEDIGKMPDLNLAESIQRVPGVAITREGGEGRQVTVRGLGPDFTRMTLNGMEVPASGGGIDSSGGINRSRAIDFNIFASELFNRIDINKSQRASIEEGGIASTIDLYTARPFDYDGLTVRGGLQFTVDNLADETDPRITAFVSNTFLDDKLGVLFSVAKSERNVRQEGFGSVRYSSPNLQGSNNAANNAWANGGAGAIVNGTITRNDACAPEDVADPINCLFTPRLPRLDYFSNTVDRLGLTGSVQFRPTDSLEFGLDLATSKLENERISYNYAAQFRSQWQNITPVEITVDPSGKYITAGEFDGVRVRSESRGQFSETKFNQAILYSKWDISDTITMNAMYGRAESDHKEEQDRFNIDGPAAGTSFSFDFSDNRDVPNMSYGDASIDGTDYSYLETGYYTTAGGTLVRQDELDRKNDTFKVDVDFDLDAFQVKTGVIANKRTVDSLRLDATLTAPAANQPVDNYPGLAVLYSSQVGGGFASSLEDVPSGFPRDFMVMDIGLATSLYGVGTFTPNVTDPSSFSVEEKTTGLYGEVDYTLDIGAMDLLINAGLRYVETETTASGASDVGGTITDQTADNKYDNLLPALNLVLNATDELMFRFAANQNITRPSLGSLVPRITSATPINGNVSMGNPNLDPMKANSFDLGVSWYFAEESLLEFTYFTKDIEDFISTYVEWDTLDPQTAAIVASLPAYDPDSPEYLENAPDPYTAFWNIQRPVNADDVDINGYEIIYQQPLYFLPSFLSNFGLIANYTYVDGEATVQRPEGGTFSSEVPGLSENSYNLTLYYEMENWGARISVNDRDDYVTSLNGSNGNAQEKNTGPTRMDMSAFYDINDYLSLRLEVINVTEEDERSYTTGVDGDLNLVREINNTGREVIFGITGKF